MKFNITRLIDIQKLTKVLDNGLRKLDFANNFESQVAEDIVISATSEASIRNELNFIPKKYIIVSQSGNGLVTKSSTEWTSEYLYLYNNGASEVTITVIFFK